MSNLNDKREVEPKPGQQPEKREVEHDVDNLSHELEKNAREDSIEALKRFKDRFAK